jgi:CRP/FNR family cyclic AMP-dependent transcriptional regulator
MEEKKLDVLSNIPVFAEIRDNPEHMKRLAEICRVRSYPRNGVIIREGDMGSEMFIVFSGSVEIRKRTRAGDDYTVLFLGARDRAFFGELALVDDDRRSATIIAREDSEFLVISKEDFLALGNEFPTIGLPITRAIARIIASRWRKTTQDMLTIFDALVNEVHG